MMPLSVMKGAIRRYTLIQWAIEPEGELSCRTETSTGHANKQRETITARPATRPERPVAVR